MTNPETKEQEEDYCGDKYYRFTLIDGKELRVYGSKWGIKLWNHMKEQPWKEKMREEFEERFRPIDFCHTGEGKMPYVEAVIREIEDYWLSRFDTLMESKVRELQKLVYESDMKPHFPGGATHFAKVGRREAYEMAVKILRGQSE